MDRTVMILYHKACIQKLGSFSLICWYGHFGVKLKNALTGIVKVSSEIMGIHLNSLSDLYNKQVVKKVNSFLSDLTSILNSTSFLPVLATGTPLS